jgi:hypothetical protein
MSTHRAARIVTTGTLLTCLAGCAVTFGGTHQTLAVQSTPPGRAVTVDGVSRCDATPCTVELSRGDDHTLVVAGNPQWGIPESVVVMERDFRAGMLVCDIFFTALIGIIVDAATQAWYNLEPIGVPCAQPLAEGCGAIVVQ